MESGFHAHALFFRVSGIRRRRTKDEIRRSSFVFRQNERALALDCAARDPFDDLALREEKDDEDRQ